MKVPKKPLRSAPQGTLSGVAIPLVLATALAAGCGGREQDAGRIQGPRRSDAALERSDAAEAEARDALLTRSAGAAPDPPKQILFGDLHVHTTFSIDAYLYALPIFGGQGVHPPADACDFARYCAGLDFFSLNDHAEGLTPRHWEQIRESLRECNARAGDPANPDLVAFVGWEWTQTGTTPETHFGHKNVMFPGLEDDELPARPINALPDDVMQRAPNMHVVRALQSLRPLGLAPYADFLHWLEQLAEIPICPSGVDTRELPPDCRENAPTPELLFQKLASWGFETLVIPHGLAWGIHAPPGARLDVQLTAERHAPEQQRLLEIFSGHGSSEEFRDFEGTEGRLPEGEAVCSPPSADFLPCCWQAGEIVRSRCGDLPEAECEARVVEARRLALEAGRRPHWVLPDASAEEWLDCDQCRDCFKPVFTPRPGESAQVALALSGPDGERFRFGLIGSSDIHSARSGTGYKQVKRKGMTDARGLRSQRIESWLRPWVQGRQDDPARAQPAPPGPMGFRNLLDVERGASFLYPGGLVAVHATGRDRRSIWDALVRREVYATSGPRILLWFDLLDASGGRQPMGSETRLAEAPRFEVRAAGAFRQRPGCPEDSRRGLSPERLEQLCLDECYHPGEERHPITAIEVVRIRPQRHPDEPVGPLIEDPWRRFECPPDPSGCVVRFEDPDHPRDRRDAVYYVRALQEPTAAINAANLRTSFDSEGNAISVDPCYGGWRTSPEDDCLAPAQERAWSSPIFVDWPTDR